MADNKFTGVKIVSDRGEVHRFANISDLKINVESGLLDVQLNDGSFVVLLDGLKYFQVGLTPQQGRDVRFKQCDVGLTALEGETSQIISIPDIVNCEWKADQGLFMAFAKTETFGFNLEHVVSYDIKNK